MTILRRLDAVLGPHRAQIAELIAGVDSPIRRASLVAKAHPRSHTSDRDAGKVTHVPTSQPSGAAPKNLLQRAAQGVNAVVGPLVTSPRWGRLTGRWMAVVTYTGRRTGRTFSIPVAHSRAKDTVTVGVQLPEKKRWWRNFLGEGGPTLLRLGGVDEPGHAVAHRDEAGKVTVAVQLG